MVTLFGVLVLSIGLVHLVFMTGSAGAVPPVKDDPLPGVTQNWDKNLPSGSRFTVLSAFGGAAVRDNNTGLVWEQTPDNNNRPWNGTSSTSASSYCANKLCQQDGWGHSRLATALGGGVKERAGSLVASALYPGERLYRRPERPLLVGNGGCMGSYSRVARILPF
jgi:hypothetical protein